MPINFDAPKAEDTELQLETPEEAVRLELEKKVETPAEPVEMVEDPQVVAAVAELAQDAATQQGIATKRYDAVLATIQGKGGPEVAILEAQGVEQLPEVLIEGGEKQNESIVQQIRREGEMVLFRLFQGLDTVTGRKHHPEVLRKILMEFEKPITDIETYRAVTQTTSLNKVLMPALEVAYGTFSLGARKAIEGILQATAIFGRGTADLSERASQKFRDAKNLYGMGDK